MSDTVFGGGIDSVAHKACLAALGYEWDIGIDAFTEAAYDQEFESRVMAMLPKREFQYINPQNRKPVYSYSGAVYIMPGCRIEGYNIDLVCVTEKEAITNKGINCAGIECGCFKSPDAVSPSRSILSGGALSQGETLERAFPPTVIENSEYVYDHVRVRLTIDKKYEDCLPEGYEDGLFYSPLTDTTAFDIIGCYASPTTGKLTCNSGVADALGFGNAFINDVEVPQQAFIGESLAVIAYITSKLKENSDEKYCLQYKLYQGDPNSGGRMLNQVEFIDIIQDYTNSPKTITLYDRIPDSLLGIAAQPTIVYSSDVQITSVAIAIEYKVIEAPSLSKSSSVILKDTNGNGIFECNGANGGDHYRLSTTSSPNKLSTSQSDGYCVIDSGDIKVGIKSVTPAGIVRGRLEGKEITVTFNFPGGGMGSSRETELYFTAEMRKAKEQDCKYSMALGGSTDQTEVTRRIKVYNARTEEEIVEAGVVTFGSIKITREEDGVTIPITAGKYELESDKKYAFTLAIPQGFNKTDVNGKIFFDTKEENMTIKGNEYVFDKKSPKELGLIDGRTYYVHMKLLKADTEKHKTDTISIDIKPTLISVSCGSDNKYSCYSKSCTEAGKAPKVMYDSDCGENKYCCA